MRKHDPSEERLPAIGRPPQDADPSNPPKKPPDINADFAEEHDNTTVSDDIPTGEDERESESPHGWAGLDST